MTPAFVKAGTARFAIDGSSVWNHDQIKVALMEMSKGKCAYCEIRLGEGAVYLEVEHFLAKKYHPHLVLDWSNLLPACRRCNGKKGNWDSAAPGQGLVNPVTSSPSSHIRLDEAYRPVSLTTEGENTIIEIDLHDIHRLGVLRYKLGETYKRKLEDLEQRYSILGTHTTHRQRREVVRSIKKALDKCSVDQPFSAVVSTVLMRSDAYRKLKVSMKLSGDWDSDLAAADAVAAGASLA